MATTYNLQPTTYPQTFIFIGRSGSGKGTQADLLEKYLKEHDPKHSVMRLETGQRFRDFVAGDSYSSGLSREIADKGGLQPSFLAIHFWAEEFLNKLTGEEHLFMDGVGRMINEARILSTALEFYSRTPANVIYLNVARDWANERLVGRGRHDDLHHEHRGRRQDWFESEVIQTVDYMKNDSHYRFHDIHGEQPIGDVHAEIISKVFNI